MFRSQNKDHVPGQFNGFAFWALTTWLKQYVTLFFRPKVSGWGHLPEKGPYMLVSNHSAGIAVAEILSFAVLYTEQFKRNRPIAGFAHHMFYRLPGVHQFMRSVGAIPSTYQAAEEALNAGVPLLVFPGGDHESLRPIWKANEVDFNNRKGFLKIARKAGIPIVPMGIRGSHYTSPILLRSSLLAWLLVIPRLAGLKRTGLSLGSFLGIAVIWTLPLHTGWLVALSWGWVLSLFQFFPIVPWTVSFKIGPPLSHDELFKNGTMQEAYDKVTQQVQELVLSPARESSTSPQPAEE